MARGVGEGGSRASRAGLSKQRPDTVEIWRLRYRPETKCFPQVN